VRLGEWILALLVNTSAVHYFGITILISYWFIDIYCGGGGGSRTRCPPWNHWGYWWGRSTFAVPDL